MLVKSHSYEYLDEFGFISQVDNTIRLGDSLCKVSPRLKLSSVVKVIIRWMDKDIRVSCAVADTESKKRLGLQQYKSLSPKEGMYFPYSDYTDVVFHQGSVSFPLDLIFLRDDSIVSIESDTKVGSSDKWSCANCNGVLEVNGGYCKSHNVELNDAILISAISEKDVVELERERKRDAMGYVV